jgi:hypothetical protein
MNRRLTLKSQLYSLKMTKKMTIEEHLWNVSTFTGQIANIGIAIPNEELVDRVLTSLPSSWDLWKSRKHAPTGGQYPSEISRGRRY